MVEYKTPGEIDAMHAAGQVLARVLAGGIDQCAVDPNGWTVRSTDGSRAAHVEHTVAITSDGPVVLTASG